jgi:hypothetical protein
MENNIRLVKKWIKVLKIISIASRHVGEDRQSVKAERAGDLVLL